ncbi:PD-(D/E)XK nuclease-like domain-containing protein [Blautia sp. Sow4_E7]|uniref:PD-(D/E)XK nuclease-like domain-containing protein n=1 Tax=Blautia sp. Sow4_E7 TaxID=3438749 RepID=UPI003F935707
MELNQTNYYSDDANREFFSVSQYKSFMSCEARAMAEISGEYVRPVTRALLVGSFVDRYFEGTLEDFMKENPAIFTRKKELRAEFKRANQIIETVKTDPKFMDAMSGEKQRIFTFELFGVKWKAKLDSYNAGKAITDLKVVAKMYQLPQWRYDLQGAVYQKGVEICTGEKLPFYLAVVTKEMVMDRDIWQIPQSTLDMALRQVEGNIGRYADVKAGYIEPHFCGKCDYCKSIKKATVRNYNELLMD